MAETVRVPRGFLANTAITLAELGAPASTIHNVLAHVWTQADRFEALKIKDEKARRDFYVIVASRIASKAGAR